jgi:putative transposase
MIMGFYISFHAPSSMSVLQCLKMAMLPKDCLLAKYPDIKEFWPARGIPEMIACDNGMDLHSDAFDKICLEMGIEILYCPAGIPEMKGAIERMFRTLNEGLIHRLPGTVFSNIDERGDYPSEEVAAIDLDTLTHLVIKWITEVYHRRKHRELKMPPLTAWIEGEQQRIIEMPAYPEQLDVLVGIPAKRTLWHYGIENDCLRYNSQPLQLLRARVGGNPIVSFKFYEHDVGYIHVFDEINQEYIRVPAVDAEYATGLTSHLHTLIRQYVERKYGTEQYEDLMLQAKQEIQQIIGEAVKDKKMATRKKVAVVTNQNSDDLLGEREALNEALKPKDEDYGAASDVLDPGIDDDLPDYGVYRRTGTEG